MSWKFPAALLFLTPTAGQKKNEEKRREKRAWEREREKRQEETLKLCKEK
jgi:hypothetical protein